MNNKYSMSAWVTCSRTLYHRWPKAPDRRAFLRNLHRHVFVFKARADVHHDDRDLEFFDFQEHLEGVVGVLPPESTMSCEQMGIFILELLDFVTEVEVSEDGENGAVVKRIKE